MQAHIWVVLLLDRGWFLSDSFLVASHLMLYSSLSYVECVKIYQRVMQPECSRLASILH